MLSKYDILQDTMLLYCDNLNAINISKTLVQHGRTKHIDIRHHFIHELVEVGTISMQHVCSSDQLVDFFTQPLEVTIF